MRLDFALERPGDAAIARLQQLDDAALDDVVVAAAQFIANDARANVPVDTGTLRRSITVETVAPGDVRVGSDVAYARRIEYGFHAADRRGRQYHQAAQPFLRPAFDANQERVQQAIVDGARAMMRAALGV